MNYTYCDYSRPGERIVGDDTGLLTAANLAWTTQDSTNAADPDVG